MLSPAEKQFGILAFTSLFSVINPIGTAPMFVALTTRSDPKGRRATATKACLTAFGMLAAFAAAGGAIFSFFGITIPAFQIAGGVLFTIMAIRNLDDHRGSPPENAPDHDPSVVPLGIPLIAGPGAISTVMVLVGQAPDALHRSILGAVLLANILLTFLILLMAPALVARIGETGQAIVSKVMGLLTAVIGVQFILNGVTTVFVDVLRSVRSLP